MPTRDAQRAQTNLCTPGPRGPTATETELCLSVSCGDTGWQWSAAQTGALGATGLEMAEASWRRSLLTHHRTARTYSRLGNRPLEGTTETCAHQGPGERSSDPTRGCPRLACVSRSLWQRPGLKVACCRVGGTECSSTYKGFFDGGHHYLHYLHHTNISEKKGSKKQRRKGNMYPFECRVPKNSKER